MSTSPHSVLVNGESCAIEPDCTLGQLLERLDMAGKRIAVAVNRRVVPRSRFAATALAPGDRIEILEAVGGG